jgi:undecaprenyl-diphosphatase
MDFIHSAVLGLVQGLTEFIPVSSTGHLILARKIMGLDLVGTLSFDAILQLATGFAVLVYFWKDILNIIIALYNWVFKKPVEEKYKNLILPIIIGTIPAIVLGLLLQEYMDTIFRGTTVVAVTLVLGSILFYLAEKKFKKETAGRPSERLGTPLSGEGLPAVSEESSSAVSLKTGLFVGLYQCLALLPGFSRSGSTISGGLLSGLSREMAIRFSFLLSLPIIFGSGLYKVYDLIKDNQFGSMESSLVIASIFAFLSGLLAIHFLIKFLKNNSLNYFGIYRIILAIVILIWL